jgi:hypothetical protein
MKQHHHWGVDEIETMIPFEREVYITLLKQFIQEEKERIKAQEQNARK